MKKIFFLFIVTVSFAVKAQNPSDCHFQREGIILTKGDTTDVGTTRTRSAIDPITANLDFDMGQIEVSFNVSHGPATVYIINSMGQAISGYSCDSSMEWLIYLPIPTDEGSYTLKIVFASAEYTGSFIL